MSIAILVFLALCALVSCQVQQVNGKSYLVTSLQAAQVSDPYQLAVKYGRGPQWLSILLSRSGRFTPMTDAFSSTIDDAETLLVPLEWTGATTPKPVPTKPVPTIPKPVPTKPVPTKPVPTTPKPVPNPVPPSSGPTPGNWKKAIATYYESYPTTKEEAEGFSGDKYQGMFAAFNDKKPLSWVQNNRIVAISDKYWSSLKGKFLKISQFADGRNSMDVQVVDYCSDKDCEGCCSANMRSGGVDFLVDLEKFTAAKFLGKSPEAVVKDGLFTTIYYSVSNTASAVGDTNEESAPQSGPSKSSIGVIVGACVVGVVLVVGIVLLIVFVGNRSNKFTETV